MATKKVEGLRLEVTNIFGEREVRLFEGFTEDQLRRKLKALGGRHSEGIKEVHSITRHEWVKEYFEIRL